jgi:hypothetical protein
MHRGGGRASGAGDPPGLPDRGVPSGLPAASGHRTLGRTDGCHRGERRGAVRAGASTSSWPLADAIGELGARLRAGGALAAGDDSRAREWRELRAVAQERGLVRAHDASLWPVGGAEHRCRFVDGARWEKVTHCNGAGFWVDFDDMRAYPATPLQYLRRLELVNDILGDDIRLEGIDVGPGANDCRIRVSQPNIEGDAPSSVYLAAWLQSYGFEIVQEHRIGAYDAICCRNGDIWLFDVRPANFVLAHDDRCYPIDVLVQLRSEAAAPG